MPFRTRRRGAGAPLPALFAALCLQFAFLAAPAHADLPPPPEAQLPDLASVLPDLRRGGYVIFMRHASTDTQFKGDAEGGDLARCETQRNLSEAGRTQAAEIGRALQALGVPIGKVVSGPACRTRDTASLAFQRFDVSGDLYFALGAPAAERQRLAAVLRDMLATPPAPGSNTVVVSHSSNLREAVGIWPKPEGVAYVFHPLGNGRAEPVAKVLPADWATAVAAARK